MKVVMTGQVGLDKKDFVQKVAERARDMGYSLDIFNVGDMMYKEAPDVAKGRILDLPIARLESIRRSVFKDILAAAREEQNLLVNTHATFRWNHGLFFAFDHDHMAELDADLYIVLVDDIDRVHYRLTRDGHEDHTLKDLMVWREEEILTTELLSRIVRGHGCFYIHMMSHDESSIDSLVRLIFHPDAKKAYLSFPMSHVMDMPDTLNEIAEFRQQLKKYMVCFDPADLEEKPLTFRALEAAGDGKRTLTVGSGEQKTVLDVSQLVDIIPDIDGQIYVRDFKLIDQADMIISLIPELPGGKPALSSGVERELQHAHESTREAFVIWKPQCEPSPFVTETATKVFRSTEEAIDYFLANGYVPNPHGEGGLFG
jgi:adenylate kinase